MLRRSLSIAVLALAAWSFPALAESPAVARPRFTIAGQPQAKGIVFFVPADAPGGAAAIGTAHSFPLDDLVGARRGEIVLGRSGRVVTTTSGFLVEPGRPFNSPGAGLADDYVAYALDSEPRGVRLLGLEPLDQVTVGSRVQILGIPSSLPHDEDDIFGRIVSASTERIEVDLDVPYDLRGWGGAPVLADESKLVIGILQAHFPKGSTSRVIVSPLRKLRRALESPLDAGRGRAFASFRGKVKEPLERMADPAPSAPAGASRRTAGKQWKKPKGPLLPSKAGDSTRVHVAIEYPPDGATVGTSACGVFVAGRALALHGELKQFDVVLVLDTSRSTIDPTGADINGNGVTGKPYLGRIGSIFDVGSTDPGDSILAAEVTAAKQLLRGLDPRSTRVGVVAFAGDPPEASGGLFMRRPRSPAVTLQPLTDDYSSVTRALDGILARDPEGSTHMAAGVDQATVELMGLRGAASKTNPRSEKVVLFFTDGQPTLPYGPGFESDNVRAVLRAANRASRAEIRIHSFAIGPDALEGPVATVEMAQRTDGFFTPVRHPGDLVNVVEEVSFANLEDVIVKNRKTGEVAERFRQTADGSWAAFVRMEPGPNELEISATANDGTQASTLLGVNLVEGAPGPEVPPQLALARNRLLEDCLRTLKQVRLDAERERAEQVRKDLMVQIEKERMKARQRADDQRKSLELQVDKDDTQ